MWILYGSFHSPRFCRMAVLLRWFAVCRRVCVCVSLGGEGKVADGSEYVSQKGNRCRDVTSSIHDRGAGQW